MRHYTDLCWFQTSLPLTALPLCRVIIACCFRVAALSGNAALALSPSGIAPKLNRIQPSAICRGGQSGKVIDLLARHCLPLGHAGFRLTCRLPHCRYAAWSLLAVSELQLSAATPLWLFTERQSLQSWIEFNCLRFAAVGKAARLSIYWLDAACRLVIPLRQVTSLAQLN